jgi:hypothetical protein
MPDTSNVKLPRGGNGSTQAAPSNFLSQKVAGVPVWIALAVVSVAIFVYLQKKKTTTTTAAKTPTATQGATGTGISGPTNYLEQGLAANAQAATTNAQWEANAEAVLNGYGYPFVQVQAALNQYLAGGVLSSIQSEIVNAAIEAVGAPPNPPAAPPVSVTTPAPTTPTPVPPATTAPAPATTTPSNYSTEIQTDAGYWTPGEGSTPVTSVFPQPSSKSYRRAGPSTRNRPPVSSR